MEDLIRLSLGDRRTPAERAGGLPAARRGLLLARVALAAGDHPAALEHLTALPQKDGTPRPALVRPILLAAPAIERTDAAAAGIVGGVREPPRRGSCLNTVG